MTNPLYLIFVFFFSISFSFIKLLKSSFSRLKDFRHFRQILFVFIFIFFSFSHFSYSFIFFRNWPRTGHPPLLKRQYRQKNIDSSFLIATTCMNTGNSKCMYLLLIALSKCRVLIEMPMLKVIFVHVACMCAKYEIFYSNY